MQWIVWYVFDANHGQCRDCIERNKSSDLSLPLRFILNQYFIGRCLHHSGSSRAFVRIRIITSSKLAVRVTSMALGSFTLYCVSSQTHYAIYAATDLLEATKGFPATRILFCRQVVVFSFGDWCRRIIARTCTAPQYHAGVDPLEQRHILLLGE
jgi:hypothetical protein